MLVIIDSAGFIHLIPRERLVSISMLPPEPATTVASPGGVAVPSGDPPGTKMKLLISYDTTTPQLGQLVFYFTDSNAIMQLKAALRQWAAADAPNQFVIDAGQPSQPAPTVTNPISIE